MVRAATIIRQPGNSLLLVPELVLFASSDCLLGKPDAAAAAVPLLRLLPLQ